jgi:hypothetical protein
MSTVKEDSIVVENESEDLFIIHFDDFVSIRLTLDEIKELSSKLLVELSCL